MHRRAASGSAWKLSAMNHSSERSSPLTRRWRQRVFCELDSPAPAHSAAGCCHKRACPLQYSIHQIGRGKPFMNQGVLP
jgi:hypothetical protein